MSEVNIYGKLAAARKEFHSLELVKTGRNKYAGYSYFELGDFLIPAMKCLHKQGLVPVVSFDAETASMMLYEVGSKEVIVITSPMVNAQYKYIKDEGNTVITVNQGAGLKGCHPIQNLGAVETYQRRYLWVALMEIVEHDALDAGEPVQSGKPASKPTQQPVIAQEIPNEPNDTENVIEDAQGAKEVTDLMIQLAGTMHSNSLKSLGEFWKANKKPIDLLDQNWPEEYARLKAKFTEIKSNLQKEQT